ncbi:MAG: Transcription termination/antitermination protein NusA [Flavobacteriales bacterium UBA4585]|jgi:N utilization substance protein A|nr:transcription termination/antitermination protein NusA [Cryomorphaceae bacterium]MCH1455121.1 transcription termination factor NusA [Schleiferiaceae bacterium]CAI8158529.1 MAG: Transcription termination/antitermination protein NusA [Flavobacteriales bacterium UBA4585]HBK20193.1 transcription termination/antitermination protein NusA [Cryomorphaceae bacterium]|tara:strand:+ start:3730 stop:4977 length:1248 start_codon:yes stop_codon:yes gene_type:complete
MENQAIIESFLAFKEEKNIDRITLMAFIEEAFRNQLRKKYEDDENFDVIVNPDKGDLEIWRNRTVVEDGAVEDDNMEIELSAALKIEPDYEVGEEVSEEVKLIDLGRRFILAFRQNLVSRIQEHDSSELFKRYKDLEGEIITGEVHHVRHREVIVYDDEGNELILPKDQMIGEREFFRKGDPIRAVVKEVVFRGTKPVVIMSRTDERFLAKLFEQEIPEVYDGLITIKGVVRIPGEKAKVAVESYDDRIDPVGACVGMKGSRIHSIVRELRNENIDVINYTTNLQLYIQRALSPAKVTSLNIDEEAGRVEAFLAPDQVSLAIGRGGTNIRLASKLVSMEIDVYRDDIEIEDDIELDQFSDEIEAWVIAELKKIGCDTAKSVLKLTKEELVSRADLEVETAEHILNVLQKEFEDEE